MKRSAFSVFIICFSLQCFAQQSSTVNQSEQETDAGILLVKQRNYLFEIYYKDVGGVDQLVNGREYIPYYPHSKLKPLLFIGKAHTASLLLNGREYNNLPLEYDTYSDVVIYADTTRLINNRYYQIALNKDPIDGFNLYFGQDSLKFRYIRFNEKDDSKLEDGFYEVAYEGVTDFFIRHKSVVHEKEGKDEYYYSPVNYVKIGNAYERIRTTKGFVKLFGDKSEHIKKFIHLHNINIKRTDKQQLISILKYYEILVKED